MKKILCITIFLMSLISLTAQNSLKLTFLCQTIDGGHLQPDSITIENITRGWEETIFFPDTIYTLAVGTDVAELNFGDDLQVMPNPFYGFTRVNIVSQKTENAKIIIYDISGRICTKYEGKLEEGSNVFEISLTTPQTYILSVQTSSGIKSIKMENLGGAGVSKIKYQGNINNMKVNPLKSKSTYPFEIGDEFRCTAYVYLNDNEITKQTITQNVFSNAILLFVFPIEDSSMNNRSCIGSVNHNETGFGDRISYIQDIDGEYYPVVQIGNQCWMKTNLRTKHFPDGALIETGTSFSQNIPYCYYHAGTIFYNWKAAIGNSDTNATVVQGICPNGWHLPSLSDWNQLKTSVNNCAKELAYNQYWVHTNNTFCTPGADLTLNNSSGFDAKPEGFFYPSWSDSLLYPYDYHETTILWGSPMIFCRLQSGTPTVVILADTMPYLGGSIRCVRNNSNNLPSSDISVTTEIISDITTTTATCKGHVNFDTNYVVNECGVCWSTSHLPSINDNYIGCGTINGNISVQLSGLTENTDYYVRLYANTPNGVVYGNVRLFSTFDASHGVPCSETPVVTDYDGNIYNTVQIGSQCWLKDNIRTTHYEDGTYLEMGTTYAVHPYRYSPDNVLINASLGYLYNWKAATDYNVDSVHIQGVCPNGWHIPSESDWTQLGDYLSSQSEYICGDNPLFIARSLASNRFWEEGTLFCGPGNNPILNNVSGYNAIPVGEFSLGSCINFGTNADFWCADGGGSYGTVKSYGIARYHAQLVYSYPSKAVGLPVRCIKN
jgi:uncharacterized protein (TIGR02145 family)